MRPTAKQYGLQMNRYYDGRRDVIASTQAALDFWRIYTGALMIGLWRWLPTTPVGYGL